MASLTIELSTDTTVRLEQEARDRGMDFPSYVRLLLGDENRGTFVLRKTDVGDVIGRQPTSVASSLALEDSFDSVVAAIRARGPGRSQVQEATADLANLLRTDEIDPGVAPAEWDRRWAAFEGRQKALDLVNTEKTQREIQRLLAEDDREC